MSDRHRDWRSDSLAAKRQSLHTPGLDSSRAFWPARSKAIAKVDPCVTVSISPLDSKVAKPSGSAKKEVERRIETNEAEEAQGRNIEVKATSVRKDEVEEGRVGRKGESLESEEEFGKEIAEEAAVAGGRELAEADRPEYEARKHTTARRPLLPTKVEIVDHYPLHLNYRSWCKHCLGGKVRSNQHSQSNEEKVRLGVTWNADYAFMSGEHNEGGARHAAGIDFA